MKYKLVFLQVADPNAENFASANMIELEWEPSLKNLRKDEFSSVSIVAKNGKEFIASYST